MSLSPNYRTKLARKGSLTEFAWIKSMRLTRFTLTCGFAMLPSLAWAVQPPKQAIWYARDLQKLCAANKTTDPGKYGMCWSFVSAVFEIASNQEIYGYAVCVDPPYVTTQKAVEVTSLWLRAHPDAAMEPASLATARALAAAYPRKTKR